MSLALMVGAVACGSASGPAAAVVPSITAQSTQVASLPMQTVAPTARPTAAAVAPTSRATAPPNLCGAPANPWHYNFCGGGTISAPPSNFCTYFACIVSFWASTKGYVEECMDGTYSHSGGRSGSCSSHGGNLRPLDA